MSNYKRLFVPGGTYFFTVVTYDRQPILTSDLARPILRASFLRTQKDRPFTQLAIVLLPDHLHAIWILPPGDEEYAMRWKRIKEDFTRDWLQQSGREQKQTESQLSRGERGVWQPRFWEHVIRDERDLESHFDYIHWNPAKHELVSDVADWQWSTFHTYRESNHYAEGWGSSEPISYREIDDFGEPD